MYCKASVLLLFVLLSNSNESAASKPQDYNFASTDCSIDLLTKYTDTHSPVFLYNYTTHYKLIVPEKGVIKLKYGEMMTIACTENKNYLTATNSNATYAACDGGETFNVAKKIIKFDDFKCKKTIRGDVKNTQEKCGSSGHFIEIGYRITTRHWVSLIKLCYDENYGDTLYTIHTLHGSAIKYASKATQRPNFRTEGLGREIAAAIAYKQTFQKSTFNKLLGSAQLAEQYINKKSFLSRGHLSPAADFLYTTSQIASYFLINTCPQWQVINGGNWKSLEMAIRRTAERYGKNFTIITGTYGVLSLPDVYNNDIEIYLVSEDKLAVPKYVWKIMYNPDSRHGVALIVLNNPFAANIKENDVFCQNICGDYGWSSHSWSDISRGYVFCCDLNKFIDIVDSVPELDVSGVLRGL